ncbi:hypothetical protein EWB00_002224 [Schistosoma japonicum]|uniref:Uncharacterized protein n=1 Tax=Schistosoma japonicum TaxID=6182 RepID=A0A4Z2DD95_SCHJA|nr:hypothetical protein KSF78_0007605 [Schistosoma japonicum]TNN14376.1 hypothetical protein EWB00_002224 [Schistosoma japonicum]
MATRPIDEDKAFLRSSYIKDIDNEERTCDGVDRNDMPIKRKWSFLYVHYSVSNHLVTLKTIFKVPLYAI